MNMILAFVQIILLIIIVLIEYKNASVVIFLWATLLVMFGLPHFVSVLTQRFIYPENTYIQASLFVILFNIIYMVSRYFFRFLLGQCKVFDLIREEIQKDTELFKYEKISRRMFLTMILYFLTFLVFVIRNYGSILKTSWGLLYTSSLSFYSLGFNLKSVTFFRKYILFATGGLFTYYFYKKNIFKSFLIAIVIIMSVIISRNRVEILPLIIPILFQIMLKYKELRFVNIVKFCVIGFSIIYTIYAFRLFRHYGDLATFITSFEFRFFNEKLFNMLLNGDGELGLKNVFLYFIYNDNNFPNFNQGHTYLRLLLMFLPTKYSFGLKPPDFAISMGSAWIGDFNNTRYSVHPTLYGDSFANLYWYGIMLAAFWALFASLIDKIISRSNLIKKLNYISILGTMYVIIGRGSVYNGIHFAVVSVIIFHIMYGLYCKFPELIFIRRMKKSKYVNTDIFNDLKTERKGRRL